MASSQIIPTRMELSRIKHKLQIARKGHKLLKDKRDELMRQFMIMVKENMALRKKVEAGITAANTNFAPKQKVSLDMKTKNVMSVNIPQFEIKTRTADPNDIYSYGYAFTSGDLDYAVKSLADVLPDMLELAEKEKACQLMADEIEKTRRRVNALEYVVIPECEENIKYISMKLEENDRDTKTRLMKMKDLVLEDAHHYEEREEERGADPSGRV